MEIGIFTFHFAHNYGAMLQAYALVTKLNKLGYQAEIIDFRFPYIYRRTNICSFRELITSYRYDNSLPIAILKATKLYVTPIKKTEKWRNFEKFINNNLKTGLRITEGDLKSLPHKVFIFGSDQIWNPKLTGRVEPTYFGIDLPKSSYKISYAASAGTTSLDTGHLNQLIGYLPNLNSISVREEGLGKFLSPHFNGSITSVIDPVFLLSLEEWQILCNQGTGEQYLLTYSFNEDSTFMQQAINIAKVLKLKIVRLCFEKNPTIEPSITQIDTAGPIEFLTFFRNATFILTNSFHGTAFAIIFEKDFYCIPPSKYRDRVDELIKQVDLKDRILENNDVPVPEQRIDYKVVKEKLNDIIDNSLSFLKDSLDRANGKSKNEI